MSATEFSITPRGPFNWDLAVSFLAGFPATQRHVTKDGQVKLTFIQDGHNTAGGVTLTYEDGVVRGTDVVGDLDTVKSQAARILSLDVDGTDYPLVGEREPAIGILMVKYPGLRPVLFPSPYECACWGVISQRISKQQAAKIAEHMASHHGTQIQLGDTTVHAFPDPAQLQTVDDVPSLPHVKLDRLKGIAQAAQRGDLDAETIKNLPEQEAMQRLQQLPGIGPFWASGIRVRAAGIVNEFPNEPLSLAALKEADRATPGRTSELTPQQRFSPFAMWVCVLLRFDASRTS